MTKFSVAIAGGGIAGLCLAAELLKEGNIQVDVYEASNKFGDIGAGITLWGRVCEVLRLMDMADDCIQASSIASTTRRLSTTTEFKLRDFHGMIEDLGSLNFKDAWNFTRAEFLHILLRRVPPSNTHLGKRLQQYTQDEAAQTTTLKFSDGTSATCDVLIGCDGIQSRTRAQMMRKEGTERSLRCVEPRWHGTVAYRVSTPISRLAVKNPKHSMLSRGQIFVGKNQHIVGYPISPSKLNIAVNITHPAKENTRWPRSAWARKLDQKQFAEEVIPLFVDWDPEAREAIQTIDSAIEWAMHDLEPLPFYVKGRIALMGDAAHASMPYLGAGPAHAIEDAYVLSRVLCADATTRHTLPMALEAYQTVRLPYGNKHILSARAALRAFQRNGPGGNDRTRVAETIRQLFDDVTGIGGSTPEEDAKRALLCLKGVGSALRGLSLSSGP